MTGNWKAPPPTAEQVRHDELKAAGLRRGFMGRVEPIPVSIVPADFVKRLDDQVKDGRLTVEDRQRAIGAETMRLHAQRIEELHQRGVAEAAANTAQREAEASAQRAEQTRLWTESEAQKSARSEERRVLAGRALGGGLLADRRLFEETWQRHLAQRAIAESAAPGE